MARHSLVGTGSLLLCLLFVSCDEEAESATAAEVALVPTGKPWETMPAESLYGATATENLTTTRVELDVLGIPDGWEGLRIAAISDFQLGLWGENEAVATAAATRAAQLQPDLVVLLGDFIARGQDTDALRRVLAPLRGTPVAAVLGDRDIVTDSMEARITETLSASGVRLLKNGSIPFVHNDDTAYVAGVDPDLADEPGADQAWILSQLGGARPALLLSHSPIVAARSPTNRYPGIIAGGTFCGRVEIPGTPRLSWVNEQGLPGAAVPEAPRLFRLSRSVMFVTCGVGYSFVPVRFGAPPEVALITLHRSGLPGPTAATPSDSVGLDSLLQRFGADDTTSGSP